MDSRHPANIQSSSPRWRRLEFPDDGWESDDSMPSLQTVSDSSDDDEGTAYTSEEDEDDDTEGLSDDDDLPPLPSDNTTTASRSHPNPPTVIGLGSPNGSGDDEEINENHGFDPTNSQDAEANHRERVIRAMDNLMTSEPGDVLTHIANFTAVIGHLPPQELLDEMLRPLTQPQHEPEPDQLRAQTIMAELEVIPETLVGKYEKLRGGDAADAEGCAICRESFFPQDEEQDEQLNETFTYFAALPGDISHPPSILAFPCPGMHLFHDRCISPWLSRKTTCPSCRFDIDPDSLTLYCIAALNRDKKWAPPEGRSFLKWLQDEESKHDRVKDDASLDDHPPLAKYGVAEGLDADLDDEWESDDDEDNMHHNENDYFSPGNLLNLTGGLLFPPVESASTPSPRSPHPPQSRRSRHPSPVRLPGIWDVIPEMFLPVIRATQEHPQATPQSRSREHTAIATPDSDYSGGLFGPREPDSDSDEPPPPLIPALSSDPSESSSEVQRAPAESQPNLGARQDTDRTQAPSNPENRRRMTAMDFYTAILGRTPPDIVDPHFAEDDSDDDEPPPPLIPATSSSREQAQTSVTPTNPTSTPDSHPSEHLRDRWAEDRSFDEDDFEDDEESDNDLPPLAPNNDISRRQTQMVRPDSLSPNEFAQAMWAMMGSSFARSRGAPEGSQEDESDDDLPPLES